MRCPVRLTALSCLLGLVALAATAQQDSKITVRYGVVADINTFPQTTAKEALSSTIKAIDQRRFDYLLAHLTDPDWLEQRIKQTTRGGQAGFDQVVREVSAKLTEDPASVAELKRFRSQGEWEEADTTATVKLADVKDRAVFLKKVESRWYLENRKKPETKAK